MKTIPCGVQRKCPFMYSCQADLCIHESIFPLSWYSIIIYCLYPFASAICNISGNSFGEFKVLLLMDALNYSQSRATIIAYPLILGTALFNIVRLIFKRHPSKQTTLVDYNLVFIIIPCVLYGSTIGSLVNSFIPQIVADCLIMILLIAFSTKFFKRLKVLLKKSQEEQEEKMGKEMQESYRQRQEIRSYTEQVAQLQIERQNRGNVNKTKLEGKQGVEGSSGEGEDKHNRVNVLFTIKTEQVSNIIVQTPSFSPEIQQKSGETSKSCHLQMEKKIYGGNSKHQNKEFLLGDNEPQPIDIHQIHTKLADKNIREKKTSLSQWHNSYFVELQLQLSYEKTHHFRHIIAILVLFAVFETATFLAQGKIIPIQSCSPQYWLALGFLSVFFLGVLGFIYAYTFRQIKYYRKIGYQYEYPLDELKYFGIICLGSFLGGFNGGVFAIGNSTTIIFALLYLEVEPMVASATVGFQVVFAAAAALCQAIARGTIGLDEALFFFLLTLIGGGILSFISSRLLQKLNREKVNIIIVGIVASLTSISTVSMLANIGLGYSNFGSHYMLEIDDLC